MVWRIEGHSAASKENGSKQQFIDEGPLHTSRGCSAAARAGRVASRESDGLTAEEQVHVDVAPGGVGVRADLVGSPDKLRGHIPVTD